MIKRGVKQGWILSPILVNLYSEVLIEEALENVEGIKVNGKRYTDFRYADDKMNRRRKEHDTNVARRIRGCLL